MAVPPDPEVRPKAKRRRYSEEYKRDIIKRLDECKHGERGNILRSEGLYTATVANWRKELAGTTSKSKNQKILALEEENRRLKEQLEKAQTVVDVQKNFAISWG